MKKGLFTLCVVTAILISCMALLSGCSLFGGGGDADNTTPTPKEYTIQYTDDIGTHQITVTEGMPYALEVVPEKKGHTFMGLFDAEVGGTQYVSSAGASLSPFTDGKNMVLFPQFKAKDYTVILDYQGATVTGSRQLTVAYGSILPELPKNLTVEHKEFAGWYTKANCEGTQIADKDGLVPVVSVLNDKNFDLSGEYIYLFAGFKIEKLTVTCCFESGMDAENVQVEYDTPVSQIVPQTRVDGKAPLAWSKTQGGEVFNGKITYNIVLYAVEYAPVIDFDTNGGNKVNSLVARAGSTISLPTPTKDLAKFSHWEDMQGNRYDSTTMPSKSISLKAVWQAKLVFDENGGSDVDDISVAAGNKITLPTPEREGFVFAGWYTPEKEQYSSTTMPSAGVALKAGWYKKKADTVVVIGSTSEDGGKKPSHEPTMSYLCYSVDFSKYFNDSKYYNITIQATVSLRGHRNGSVYKGYVDIYNNKQSSSTYLINNFSFENITNSYKKVNFEFTASINDDIYMCFYSDEVVSDSSWNYNYLYLSDFYYIITYPDTTNLYL